MTQTFNAFAYSFNDTSDFSRFMFSMRQFLGSVRTATLAKVISCSNNGGLSAVGTLTVQLLVGMTDGAGNVTALPNVFQVPYVRLQGGSNAVIIDPQPGDMGIVVFGDRDLSAASRSKSPSAPGSGRRFSLSDALWIGGVLNDAPSQYVQFTSDGMNIVSPQAVTIQAPTIKLDGNVEVTGTTQMDGAVTGQSTATFSGEGEFNGVHVSGHHHPGVQSGGSNTGPAQG